MEFKDYLKYRWFYTSSGKLVVGGKNAEQNEQLIRKLKEQKNDLQALHTTEPGSPFSFILAEANEISEVDIKEGAIFTACFSQAWKSKKKQTSVDIFKLSSLYKVSKMKIGTWGVKGEIKRITVTLSLVLTKQNKKLRAVPPISVKSKKDIILHLSPGKIDKSFILPKIQIAVEESLNQQELLNALPAGGLSIKK